MEPMAGIATHHEASSDGLRLTLFLRGQSHPRGTAFPNTDTLRDEYLNGKLVAGFLRADARQRPTSFLPTGAMVRRSRHTTSFTPGGECSIPQQPLRMHTCSITSRTHKPLMWVTWCRTS